MDYEKKIPTAPLIVARLSRDFCCGTSRIELLHRCEKDDKHPITHPAGYYDDSGDEVPITAIESWLDVNLPELAESEDERVRRDIIEHFRYEIEELSNMGEEYEAEIEELSKYIAYLEKQKEQKPLSTEETELNSIAFLEQMGYTCIPPEKQKPEQVEESLKVLNGITGDIGRRGRQGGIPEDIRREAETFRDSMDPPYDGDDICTAYERGAMRQKPAEWSDADMKEARANLISVCIDWERGEQTTLLPIAAVRARYFLEHLTEPSSAGGARRM